MKPGINKLKINIHEFSLPYYLSANVKSDSGQKVVIFCGADYRHLPAEMNREEFVRLSNLCLDFIRKECADCKLLYKPHPAEIKDEYNRLNLDLFEMVEDTTIGEVYLMQHIQSIKYVFSVCSWMSISAYTMGLNSYVFSKLFESVFGASLGKFYKDYFQELPENFFIEDLSQKLTENKITLKQDHNLEIFFNDLIKKNKGDIWFTSADPATLSIIFPLSGLIKKIDSTRKVNLIISRHHRWNVMNMGEVGKYFDKIIIFPRPFYSLRPNKIYEAIKIAAEIKKFKIEIEDVIIGFCNTSFVENCLISYNKKNIKIAAQFIKNAEMMYGYNNHTLFNDKNFKQIKASVFYNKILEPILGLNKTLYLKQGTGKILNISRYQKPLNDVYNEVILFKANS
jgi:hypothetical protein